MGKAIKNLPNRKAAGPDGISGEHLKFGGGLLITWITQLLNAILLLENVPPSFKAVNITPFTKAREKILLTQTITGALGCQMFLVSCLSLSCSHECCRS